MNGAVATIGQALIMDLVPSRKPPEWWSHSGWLPWLCCRCDRQPELLHTAEINPNTTATSGQATHVAGRDVNWNANAVGNNATATSGNIQVDGKQSAFDCLCIWDKEHRRRSYILL